MCCTFAETGSSFDLKNISRSEEKRGILPYVLRHVVMAEIGIKLDFMTMKGIVHPVDMNLISYSSYVYSNYTPVKVQSIPTSLIYYDRVPCTIFILNVAFLKNNKHEDNLHMMFKR